MICTICNKIEAKYKCPKCYTPYCSITCNNQHKQNPCSRHHHQEEHIEATTKMKHPTVDTVPAEKLAELRHSKVLKDILVNPHLRDLIKTVDSAEDVEDVIKKAMLEPLFVEFVDECLKVVE